MSLTKLLPKLVVAAAVTFLASHASGQALDTTTRVSILNFRTASPGGGIVNDVNLGLGTTDDGDVSTTGQQTTVIAYQNFSSPLNDIPAGSVTISGITLSGAPVIAMGSPDTIFHATTGGQISLFDDNNVLLLSGDLGEQILSGPEIGGGTAFASGSLFSSGFDSGITFTGGQLLQFVDPGSGGLSINLNNIRTNGVPGLSLSETGTLLSFTANSTGQITALSSGVAVTPVPEPTSLPLLIFGLTLFSSSRRKSSV